MGVRVRISPRAPKPFLSVVVYRLDRHHLDGDKAYIIFTVDHLFICWPEATGRTHLILWDLHITPQGAISVFQ